MTPGKLPKCFRRPMMFALAEVITFTGDFPTLHPPVTMISAPVSRLLQKLFPGSHGALTYNTASPTREADFLQFLCDRCLAGRPPNSATVYDLGGTGQIHQGMDQHGRIETAADINRDRLVDAAFRSVADVPALSGDLVISSGMIEYNDDAAVIDIFTDTKRIMKDSAYLVLCQIEKSLFPKINSYLLRRSSLSFSKIFGFPVELRPSQDVVELLRAAGFTQIEVMPERFVQRFGAGRAYIVFAR